jgi:O-antigen/teichoic acid export membrane protein
VVINVMFPLLAHAHASADPTRFEHLYRRCTETLVAAMLAVPALLLFTAEPMLTLAFGPSYAEASVPLRILALALVLMTVNGWQSFVLLAGGRQGVTLRYNIVALAIAAILGVGLIPGLGMVGAACAALGTAVFVLFASTRAVTRHLDVRLDSGPLVRIIGAAAGLCGALAAADLVGAPWPALLPLALVLYPILLVGLGVVRPSQLLELWAARHHGDDDGPRGDDDHRHGDGGGADDGDRRGDPPRSPIDLRPDADVGVDAPQLDPEPAVAAPVTAGGRS